jgi:NIPSNAP
LQAQVRIYTINRGEMDNFVKHFKEQTKPIHDKIGWPVVATWINKPQNEFIWIRTHTDAADLEAKTKAFREAVAAAGITLGGNVAKMEVREVEMA